MDDELLPTPLRLPAGLKRRAEAAARADGDSLAAFTRAAISERLARRRRPPEVSGDLFEVTLSFEVPAGSDAKALAAAAAEALSAAGAEYVLSKLTVVLHDDD